MTRLTTHQLHAIIELHQEMARLGMDLTSVMSLIVNRLQDMLAIDGVVIELKEQDQMVYRACAGLATPYLGMALPANESLSGICMQTGALQHCPNVEKDPRVNLAACHHIGIKSMLIIPLQYFDMPVGVLKVMSRHTGRYAARRIAFLQMIAEQLGSVMYYCSRYGADNLLYQATHDSLTDLVNRSVFMEALRKHLRHPAQYLLVAVLDMNDLKMINDNYGHRCGDQALVEISRQLKNCFRPEDTVARLGGDEFAVLMPFATPPDVATLLARLKDQTSLDFTFDDCSQRLTLSVGHALFPSEETTPEALLHRADLRMYAQKRATKAIAATIAAR